MTRHTSTRLLTLRRSGISLGVLFFRLVGGAKQTGQGREEKEPIGVIQVKAFLNTGTFRTVGVFGVLGKRGW